MGLIGETFDWFTTAANWSGDDGVPTRLREHVAMSATATFAAALIAQPVGIGLGHLRRFGPLAINVANVGRALPSFAILVLGVQVFGLRDIPLLALSLTTFIALVALAIPPMVTNSYVAVSEVGPDIRDSARGMGMSGRQLLRRVELPLAVPLIMAGVRTSAVQVVATATIAAFVGWGGLGRFVVDGIAVRNFAEVLAGSILVATLALMTEAALAVSQRLLTPRPLRGGRETPSGAGAQKGVAA